jgi:hypothetical protein
MVYAQRMQKLFRDWREWLKNISSSLKEGDQVRHKDSGRIVTYRGHSKTSSGKEIHNKAKIEYVDDAGKKRVVSVYMVKLEKIEPDQEPVPE